MGNKEIIDDGGFFFKAIDFFSHTTMPEIEQLIWLTSMGMAK